MASNEDDLHALQPIRSELAAGPLARSPSGYGHDEMSIQRRRRNDGRTAYVVRWYESGRGSTKRKRTFDRRRDAELFEASVRRARQLGQLASEVIGSNATLEEFLVEWWDTYAATHLRPNTLATYTFVLS